MNERSEIGRYLAQSSLLAFLWIGVIWASFNISRNIPDSNERLMSFESQTEKNRLKCFNILVGTLFGPADLLVGSDIIRRSISPGTVGERKKDTEFGLIKGLPLGSFLEK